MPTPKPNETRTKFIGRCVPIALREQSTKGQSHAVAKCGGIYDQFRKRLVANAQHNPLRKDPTRTATLRRKFETALVQRLNIIKQRINDLIVKEDAFGLKIDTRGVFNTRWAFRSTPEQVQEFQKWLQRQLEQNYLAATAESLENAYWHQYIEEGYRKGAGRAFNDTKKPYAKGYAQQGVVSDFYRGTKEEFLRSAFAQPVSVNKVKLLAGRVFTDLKGVSDTMATQMSRTLTDGLVQGKSPREVARDLNKAVDGLGKNRSRTIARTETIRAHAEGQLDALEILGVDEVGVAVEWSTAGDTLVCPLCAPLEGIVLKTKEAHGAIPRHPNCRCSFKPANVGEDKRGQHRTKQKINKQIEKSLKAEIPKKSKRSVRTQRKLSTWAGAGRRINKIRPKSII